MADAFNPATQQGDLNAAQTLAQEFAALLAALSQQNTKGMTGLGTGLPTLQPSSLPRRNRASATRVAAAALPASTRFRRAIRSGNLAQQNGTSVDELMRLNPQIKTGI